ncbi:CopG family transcriptional regulator [Oscillatoria laete-virens NRMC-F 0139]|nr:CopG family transcriptional regulator [Oscillatoria laete-virens]MDL5054789.1 CopG family transcriptional regulator [Oscillatoria laete-virens NRMC-F 0139]
MRTTILLDDALGERLRAEARKMGKSFSEFLADAGRQALGAGQQTGEAPFRLVTFRGEGPFEGMSLDRPSELLAAEDEEIYRNQRS